MPDVEGWRALDDPLGDELAHASRSGEAVRAEPRRHPEAGNLGGPEDELSVRCERLRPVDELHDLHLGERRHTDDRVLHELLEPGPVLVEQPRVEVGGDPAEPPGRAVALVAAHDQPAGLGTEVHEQRRIAHRGHLERKTGRLGHEVLVRHRHDRHVHTGECPDLSRVHAARVDDDLGLDDTAVGLDSGNTPACERHTGDPRSRRDLRAATPGTFRERERQLAGIDVAVRRKERGAEHAVRRHRREELLGVCRRDQLEREPEGLRPAGLAGELLHALGGRRQPERAHLVPPGLEPDLLLERAIEIDALHHHRRQRKGAPQLPDKACGMEGRAARELRPLDENDVVPPESRQPVEDGAAAHAASDHHRARALPHGRSLNSAP